jgi:beta-lactam-binding protein with PASTA domain
VHGAKAPGPAAATTVEVNRAALIGLQVQAAEQQLRQLGLSVSVTWVPTRRQVPGTVLAVQPSGRLLVGSPVVLAVASAPARHHLRGDTGNGQGGDDSQSGD